MNESGASVRPLVRRFGIEDLADLVVVHDELDLPPGRLRVKVGGGLAGHNGLRSIRSHLHADDFVRVRIGIGKPPDPQRGADHVLRRPSRAERDVLAEVVARAADAVELLVTEGPDAAMQQANTDPVPG
jgi:PTH1 family peptidyl-tRNA hydrolase